MIIRKPTTITLKPEDDYQEYEDFKKRQEEQKKNQLQQKKDMYTWSQQQQAQIIHQAPKNTRRSIQVTQEPTIEFEPDSYFDINNQIPVNQLFRMINPTPDTMYNLQFFYFIIIRTLMIIYIYQLYFLRHLFFKSIPQNNLIHFLNKIK